MRHSTALRRERIKFMKKLLGVKVTTRKMKGTDAKLEKELKHTTDRNAYYASKLKGLVAKLKGRMSDDKELVQIHTTERRRLAKERNREAEQKAKLAVTLKTLKAKLSHVLRQNSALAKHLKTEKVKVSRGLEAEKGEEAIHIAVLKKERAILAKEAIENEASLSRLTTDRRSLAKLRKDGLEQKKADDKALRKAKLEGAKSANLEGEKVAHLLQRLHKANEKLRHISKVVSDSGFQVARLSRKLKRNRKEWQRILEMGKEKHAKFMQVVARKQAVLIHRMERLQGDSSMSIQKWKVNLTSAQKNENARTAKEAEGVTARLAALTKRYRRMKMNAARLLEREKKQHALRLKHMKVREMKILMGIAKNRLHVISAFKREDVDRIRRLSQINSTMAQWLENETAKRTREHALARQTSKELRNAKATIVEILKKNRTETQKFRSEKEKDELELHRAAERVTQMRHNLEQSVKKAKETWKHDNAVEARKLGIEKTILAKHREHESARIAQELNELEDSKTKLRMLKKRKVKQANELKKIMQKEAKEQDRASSVYGNLVGQFQKEALQKVENARQFHINKTEKLHHLGLEKVEAVNRLQRFKMKEGLKRHENAEKLHSILQKKARTQALLAELRRLKREKVYIHQVLGSARKTLYKVIKHFWKVRAQLREARQKVSKKLTEVKHIKYAAKKLHHVLETEQREIADALRRKHAILTNNLTMLQRIHAQESRFRSKRSADWNAFNVLKAKLAREKRNPIFRKPGMLAQEIAREKKRMKQLRSVIKDMYSIFNQIAQKIRRTHAKVGQIKEAIVVEKDQVKKDFAESRHNILKLHQQRKKKAKLLESEHGFSERHAHEHTKIQKLKHRKAESKKMLRREFVKLRNVFKMLAKGRKAISQIKREKRIMRLSDEKKMKKMLRKLKKLQLFISEMKVKTAGKIKDTHDLTVKLKNYTAVAKHDELAARRIRATFENNAEALAVLKLVEREIKVFKARNKAKAKVASMNSELNKLENQADNLPIKIDDIQDTLYMKGDQFYEKLQSLRMQISTVQESLRQATLKRHGLERKLKVLKTELKTSLRR